MACAPLRRAATGIELDGRAVSTSSLSSGGVDLVGLGFCGWDYVCLLPEIPIDHKVEIVRSLTQGGGPSATATYAAARLGSRTAFIGAVGDDENGRSILRDFREGGVDVGGILERKGASSPVAYCWTEQKEGKRSIAWSRGSVQPLRAEEINMELVRSSRVLHLDGHQTAAALHAAKAARAAGVTVCLDAGTILDGIDALLTDTDIVIASEWFARTYTRQADLEAALRRLHKMGPRWAVVTSGEQGSLGFDGERFVRVAALPARVVDTTGAGDVYHGAFLHRYIKGGGLEESMRFAAGAAALKCEQLGGRTGIPTLGRLEEFLQQHEHKD